MKIIKKKKKKNFRPPGFEPGTQGLLQTLQSFALPAELWPDN